jgi:predicted Zn-dependent peptidase
MPKSKTNFNKRVLPNGLRIITIPRPEAMATNVLVLAETGSKYESKAESGLSHFLEHMFFKGTKRRPKAADISTELDALGANYNAFTSQEYTGYYATVQPKLVEEALDIIADMYLNSTFPEAEIKKESGVIVEEINMYEDMPRDRVSQLFLALMYGDQPAGRSILGTKETVKSFTRADFLRYQANHYVAPATVVVVSGKFNESAMIKKITKQFKTIPSGPNLSKPAVIEKQIKPEYRVEYKKSDQTHLILGVRTFSATAPESNAADVLAAVLGGGMSSRLFLKIREELGAAYYVRAENDTYTDHGVLEIAVGSDTKRVEEIITAILAECRKLTETLVPTAELERVKESMIGSLFLGLERSSSLAGFFGTEEIIKGKLESPELIAKKIRDVTAKEIKAVARRIFKTEALNLALIGPERDGTRFESLLRL